MPKKYTSVPSLCWELQGRGQGCYPISPHNTPKHYHIWDNPTRVFFANGKKSFESSETNGSRVVTSDSNIGSVHEIFLIVIDVYEDYSVESSIKIEVLSSPFIESLQCEAEAILNKELLFNVLAGDKDGRIVLYEWDFDSLSGTIDSIDYQGPEPIGAVTTYFL